ncbi:hypothetical protein TREMEDRAFT_63605 [Tremella mesenterica DSM 1558]|uniref:uncharacterized protein n=1 Tax=Tremella mesenterica (strain ATCC 24925 / CBS 8224 / DSM 1558 / NBRC 9311 / NRRL Y-6157 / RJB 2259-6 / UBC 559-6) TaxID=578456 RepID=UPI0003F48CEB|nr:uncharacterized protein TREMEDRAFT_63605 [Tremella mesenterica DSM 1558]EIW68438.1 hypothetical protein TREMEDRAFT_63605 [Tremella mesenterica DSM 1558]
MDVETTAKQQAGPSQLSKHRKPKASHSTKALYEREVVFVRRKSGLGALIRRCKSLVMDEGYITSTLHALSAAISHGLLLLDEASTRPDLSTAGGLEEEEFVGIGAMDNAGPHCDHG